MLKEAADRAVPLEELSLCVWLWRGMLWGGDGEDDNDDEDDNDNEDDLVFQMDQELDRSQQTVTITTGPLIIWEWTALHYLIVIWSLFDHHLTIVSS